MVKLFVSPNRENLKFKVAKVKKDETVAQLTWLVNELKEKGPLTPQTLIFCCTVRDIATIVNWFLVKLFLRRLAPMTWSTYLGLSMTMKVNHVTWTHCKIYGRFYILFLMFNPFTSRSDKQTGDDN